MVSAEVGTAGAPMSTVPNASWALSIKPVSGWGRADGNATQRATAGWLSVLPIFEPHWQVRCLPGVALVWRWPCWLQG